LPILIKAAAFTSTATADHTRDMAICVLGIEHDWTLQENSERIEYKPIASLTSAKAVEFIKDIIFRFGIPNSIITDLGSNFNSSEFFDFREQRSI
jgi:transposase InsO family protein